MAHKIVSVETALGAGMTVECKAGNHVFYIDQPQNMGGLDKGPTPLEYYLASLAGCVSSIARIIAMQKKIELRGIKISTKGDINTDVLLGKNTAERSGFQDIALEISLDCDLSPEQRKEFIAEVEHRCPVSENTTNPTTVRVSVN